MIARSLLQASHLRQRLHASCRWHRLAMTFPHPSQAVLFDPFVLVPVSYLDLRCYVIISNSPFHNLFFFIIFKMHAALHMRPTPSDKELTCCLVPSMVDLLRRSIEARRLYV